MASAACAAFVTARRYLTEYFAKEGYTLAIKMVNDQLMELNAENKLLSQANSLCAFYTGFNGLPPTSARLLTMHARLAFFNKIRVQNQQVLDNCKRLSTQMLSYGISAVEDRKAALNGMLTSLNYCLKCAAELEMFVREDFDRYRQQVESGVNLSRPFAIQHQSAAPQLIKEMTPYWNKMVLSYKDFFSGDRHIQFLFSVNTKR